MRTAEVLGIPEARTTIGEAIAYAKTLGAAYISVMGGRPDPAKRTEARPGASAAQPHATRGRARDEDDSVAGEPLVERGGLGPAVVGGDAHEVSWLETSSAPVSRWRVDRPGPEEQCPTEMGRPQGEAVQTRP